MAVTTQTRPATTEAPPAQALAAEGVLDSTDHKSIGRMFMVVGSLTAMVGLVLAFVASIESSDLASFSVVADLQEFTQVWSMGRDLLLLGGIIPILVGLAIYLVPLQVGSPTLVFARGAATAFWVWYVGAAMLIVAYLGNGGPGGGRSDMVQLWAASLAVMLAGLTWAMLCVATTVLGARTQGMTLDRVPVSTWGFFVFSLLGLFSLPIFIGELLIEYMRFRYGVVTAVDSAQLTGVLNGLTVAPAATWITVPVLAIAADIVAAHSGTHIRAYRSLLAAVGLLGILSFFPDLTSYASVRSIPLDNGLRVLGLLVTPLVVLAIIGAMADCIRRGSFTPRPALIGALLASLLTLALTVVQLLAQIEAVMGFLDRLFPDQIDMTNTLILNGTTFHEGIRVLAGAAAIVGITAAVSHWGVKIWGRQPSQSTAMAAIAASTVGGALWSFGEIAAGFADQPMYPVFPSESTDMLSTFGLISVVGAGIFAFGGLALATNLVASALGKASGGTVPWKGETLEWLAPSPPPIGNFVGPPVVHSPYPLADGPVVYASAGSTEGEEA